MKVLYVEQREQHNFITDDAVKIAVSILCLSPYRSNQNEAEET